VVTPPGGALVHGGQNVGQHAKPHSAAARFETHAEPLGHAERLPHLQTGDPPLVSHHSLAAQHAAPQRGPLVQPPLGIQEGFPASAPLFPAEPPVPALEPPDARPPALDPAAPPDEPALPPEPAAPPEAARPPELAPDEPA
jgi:hypothetical protein